MRLIAHITVHNFFVAAARSAKPGLSRGPFAVIRKNLVADASPEAAAKGVRPGQSRRHALQNCPDLELIDFKPDFYKERSLELTKLCGRLSPRVETPPAGGVLGVLNEAFNEAFVDISGRKPPAAGIIQCLAEKIVPHLGSFATVSIAPCRLLARAAALISPPPACGSACTPALTGLAVQKYGKFRLLAVRAGMTDKFASQLPVEVMWPLEASRIKRLKTLGLHSFGDISKIPLALLYGQFGTLAPVILDYSRGIDSSIVPVYRPPDKVVFHTVCQGAGRLQLEEILKQASLHISRVLQEKGQSCRELVLSIFFEDFSTMTKTSVFNRGKHEARSIYLDSLNLLNKAGIKGTVTELSVSAGQLLANGHSQLVLFEDPGALNSQAAGHEKRLAAVCENLSAKYSKGIITMGSNLPISRREQVLMFVDPLRKGN